MYAIDIIAPKHEDFGFLSVCLNLSALPSINAYLLYGHERVNSFRLDLELKNSAEEK